ncbi:hypothetical protein [Cellulosilyticum sp. I15G10I2]|uniref:hypothetical protein n=1 Tax=Cellulosilyticum sp. I15G10I2 TaxID=1892843 RepID=UPI00085C20A4|nr:hypothetical protein [Cellulosilyticum sp. I15G10I2]
MKVIAAHSEYTNRYLDQYAAHVEPLGKGYTELDINEKYLNWLNDLVHSMEPSFEIQLGHTQERLDQTLVNTPGILVAVIGVGLPGDQIDSYYDMQTGSTRCSASSVHRTSEVIYCGSENNAIDAISTIRCIGYLCNLAKERNKSLIIYADIHMPDEALYMLISSGAFS